MTGRRDERRSTLFDDIFRQGDEPSRRDDGELWKGIGTLIREGSSETRADRDVWANWNRSVDGEEDAVPTQESPMKKKRTRRPRSGSRRSHGTTKRTRKEPTAVRTEAEQPTVFLPLVGEQMVDDELEGHGFDAGLYEEGATGEGTRVEDDGLEAYMELFQEGTVGFVPVGTYLFVVQGWDKKGREPTDRWYHFEAKRAKEQDDCVHRETYLEFREEEFRDLEERVFLPVRVVWFWRILEDNRPDEGQLWMNRFSVGLGQEGIVAVNKRAIVSFLGSDSGTGVWTCSECSGNKCAHRSAGRRLFGEVMGTEDVGESLEPASKDEEDVVMFSDRHGGRLDDVSISYLPVRPPAWAELPSDHAHYPRPAITEHPPALIALGAQNRSPCGRTDCIVDNDLKVVKSCTVYTLNRSCTSEIELVACSSCPARKHCFVGPEPRDVGLFNYNNSVLFTHDVLDEYTSQFTSSKTPFVSFVETTNRRYERLGSKFVKEDLFRSVWFSYVRIQDFSKDMSCKRCGPEPDCLIWDGVTLGFGRKHLTDSLRPPTYTDDHSPQRQRSYPQKPQLLNNELPLRRQIRRWVKNGRKAGRKRGDEDDDGGNGDQSEDPWNVLEEFRTIVGNLACVSKDLALVFSNAFSPTKEPNPALKQAYVVFFEQVAAEESALQMINFKCLTVLDDFVKTSTWEMGSRLVDIPALYNVLELEFRLNGRYPVEMVNVAKWMLERTKAVWENTCRRDSVVVDQEFEETSATSWMQVSNIETVNKRAESDGVRDRVLLQPSSDTSKTGLQRPQERWWYR
ncbi:hypothetical protein AAF712_005638 [Marasmius tenuissimus]|uniref:HMG domain-containing protein n=1 Tax=Marasmius tenuissimus TaxID=585030 RepID=A0ABR3A259_9AGAR